MGMRTELPWTTGRKAPAALLAVLGLLAAGLTLALLGGGRSPAAGPAPTASRSTPAGPEQVDLAERVAAYTANFAADSPYRAPNQSERRAVGEGVSQLLDGKAGPAAATLRQAGYRATELIDRPSGRRVTEVADASPERERERGWGRVYLDPQTHAVWSGQVPHPVADSRTELLGVELWRAAPGGVVVIAGAHRRAGADGTSDAAHSPDTVFAAVVDLLADRGLPGIQVHGFDEGSLPGQDAVVSGGSVEPGPAGHRTAEGLRALGLNVCEAWKEKCGRLEGTTNVEGRYASDRGVPWLHVELANGLRTDPALRLRVAEALAAATRSWAKG
ncbi:hypothetical protein [Kitasatospora camelliae]|uniref:N-acetylmuramoyl-L-alanine amidase n=1 Tax=Kitasatospora camelliae TaxID=3156397 RepID=A0AAU8JVS0_9ACTN